MSMSESRAGYALSFKVENTRSRTGKHQCVSMVLIYKKGVGIVKPAREHIASEAAARGTYVRGEAKRVELLLSPGDFAIYAQLVKNYLNRVKGYITVYNHRGEMVYRAKYSNGYLRKSAGNPVFAWIVRLFVEAAKIPVKGYALGDEK